LVSSSGNTLSNNKCISNNGEGISLSFSSSNTLTYNNITDNTGYGIYSSSSDYNYIHHNNFINNNAGGVQAYDNTGTNYWDDGSEGNYWSDYTSRYPSANPIGNVWDTPYVLDGGGGARDNYPLVGQVVIPQFPAPALTIVIIIILFSVFGWFYRKKEK
jgi:parallel beta-helix repeat protein